MRIVRFKYKPRIVPAPPFTENAGWRIDPRTSDVAWFGNSDARMHVLLLRMVEHERFEPWLPEKSSDSGPGMWEMKGLAQTLVIGASIIMLVQSGCSPPEACS